MAPRRSQAPVPTHSPPRAPRLDELRTFCTAADLGSLGRAAQRLHLTQPAVSKRLQALEELVGAPLLERSARGVTMTHVGERLYAHARRLVADMEELTAVIGQIGGSRETVRLAISHTAAEFMMPKALVTMRRQTSAPVEVVIANSRLVKQMVKAAEVDVGVAACMSREVVPGVVSIPLADDEVVIAVPLGHEWARRESISADELLGTPIVMRDPGAHTRQAIDETLADHGLKMLESACEVGSTQAAKDESHELCLPTAMSRMALSPADRLEVVAVRGLRFLRRFCILYPNGPLSQPSSHLIDALRESALARGESVASSAGESVSSSAGESA